MRLSCNGCRVLRKGCCDTCTIRPCLDWILSPESQANATLFLAKFYGRAGLINLINAGPPNLRPAIFSSLIYEACGRIVNPIYGSAGLLSSGNWQLCQDAVEAVFKGSPITPMAIDEADEAKTTAPPLMKASDIRHVNNKEGDDCHSDSIGTKRRRPRRSGAKKAKRSRVCVESSEEEEADPGHPEEVHGSTSHGSSLSHQSSQPNVEIEIQVCEGLDSGEACTDTGGEEEEEEGRCADDEDGGVDLDLTLRL